MRLIRPANVPAARHRHRVVIAGAALGHGQTIPAAPLEAMGRLGQAKLGAGIDCDNLADQTAMGTPFLHFDPVEQTVGRVGPGARTTMVPPHIEEPSAPVVIVKQRGIKARRGDIDRVRPTAINRRAGQIEGSGLNPRRTGFAIIIPPWPAPVKRPGPSLKPQCQSHPQAAFTLVQIFRKGFPRGVRSPPWARGVRGGEQPPRRPGPPMRQTSKARASAIPKACGRVQVVVIVMN